MTNIYTNINVKMNTIGYIQDASFNFYEELNNSLNDNIELQPENVCLISNLPLDDTHITLPCNHKFNYYYIFNEILNIKKKNYSTFSNYNGLGLNEIRCPYCRTIYPNLLPPSLDINGVYKHNNVNSPANYSFKLTCKDNRCTNSTTTFVTPLGYYCKKHYIYWKSKTQTEGNCDKNENDKTKTLSEELNETWDNSGWKQYTIHSLKRILRENNLKVSGTKPYLISRLINNNVELPSYHYTNDD